MKAATAIKVHKFADATVHQAACVWMVSALLAGGGQTAKEDLDKALRELDDALDNLKGARSGLFAALELEDLTP